MDLISEGTLLRTNFLRFVIPLYPNGTAEATIPPFQNPVLRLVEMKAEAQSFIVLCSRGHCADGTAMETFL